MGEPSDERGTGGTFRLSGARAALVGALIGALAGLLGSVLVFVDSGQDREAQAAAHRADVRRSAYVELGAAVKGYITQATILAPLYTAGHTPEERKERLLDRFLPTLEKLNLAEATAGLVSSERHRRRLDEVVTAREAVGRVMATLIAAESVDPAKLVTDLAPALSKLNDAVARFLDEVDSVIF